MGPGCFDTTSLSEHGRPPHRVTKYLRVARRNGRPCVDGRQRLEHADSRRRRLAPASGGLSRFLRPLGRLGLRDRRRGAAPIPRMPGRLPFLDVAGVAAFRFADCARSIPAHLAKPFWPSFVAPRRSGDRPRSHAPSTVLSPRSQARGLAHSSLSLSSKRHFTKWARTFRRSVLVYGTLEISGL